MSPAVRFRSNTWQEWLAGAYFRAYALQKDPRSLDLAHALLEALSREADQRLPDSVLTKRIRRLKGRVKIALGNPAGRTEILCVFDDIGGVGASIAADEKELARLASDLCGDLSLIGEHDKAVHLAERIVRRQVHDELRAFRLARLASLLRQRALAHRCAGEQRQARTDLNDAAEKIAEALKIRHSLEIDHDQRPEIRRCKTIELSIKVEEAALTRQPRLHTTIAALHDLLRETPDFEDAEEAPSELALRVGWLGSAHLRNRTPGPAEERRWLMKRAEAYLYFAWGFSGSRLVQPWVPLDACKAMRANKRPAEAQKLALEAIGRLLPQFGSEYSPVSILQALSEGKTKHSKA